MMSSVKLCDIYKGVYILTGKEEYHERINGKYIMRCLYKEVECPFCHEKRYVRATLLSDTNKRKQLSTLCSKCNSKIMNIFDEYDENSLCTMVGKSLFIIDKEYKERFLYSNLEANDLGYIIESVREDGKRRILQTHRVIMGVNDPSIVVDHINHNTSDNRKCNLRVVSQKENIKNSKTPKSNKTGFANIHMCKRKQKWVVQNKPSKITKRFENFADAYKYKKENIINMNGEFAYNPLLDENKSLKYAGIIKDDVANGVGVGVTLFVQGCNRHCEGCQNKQTWDFSGGKRFTQNTLDDIISYIRKRPYIDHFTLSGGEPFDNIELSNIVVSEIRYNFPKIKIWVYSGYTFDELYDNKANWPILESIDVLVDGNFILPQRDITLAFRGSSNQRIIDVKKSLENNTIVLYDKVKQ